jgi:ribonuclease HI
LNPAARQWRFVLESVGGEDRTYAADMEPGARASRLELLAVVRGLEALDQPSRVTLVTRSRYVRRGLRRELSHWRERNWRWERFGQLVPIRDHDLWQRVDRTLEFHHVDCPSWPLNFWRNAAPDVGPANRDWAAVPAEPAVLIIHRSAKRRSRRRPSYWPITRVFDTLRDGLIGPFSTILRPAFTRAA